MDQQLGQVRKHGQVLMGDLRWIKYEGELHGIPTGPMGHAPSLRGIWLSAINEDPTLKSSTRALAGLLASRSDDAGKPVWGSQENIAAALGVSESTVKRAAKELETRGYVVIYRGRLVRERQANGTMRIVGRAHANRYNFVLDIARKELKRWRGYVKKWIRSLKLKDEAPVPPPAPNSEPLPTTGRVVQDAPANGPPEDEGIGSTAPLSLAERALALEQISIIAKVHAMS